MLQCRTLQKIWEGLFPSKDEPHLLCFLFTEGPWCPFIQQAGKHPPRCACSRYLPAPASHSLPEGRRPHRRMQARAFPALARHVLLLWSKQNSSLSPGHRIVTEDSVCSPHLWKKKKKKRDRAIWEVVSRERETHYNASSRCQHAVGTTRYCTGDNKSNDLVCFHLRRIWRVSYSLCQRSSNDEKFTFLPTSNFWLEEKNLEVTYAGNYPEVSI